MVSASSCLVNFTQAGWQQNVWQQNAGGFCHSTARHSAAKITKHGDAEYPIDDRHPRAASALWDDCLSSIPFAGGADAKLRSGAVRETARSIGGIDDMVSASSCLVNFTQAGWQQNVWQQNAGGFCHSTARHSAAKITKHGDAEYPIDNRRPRAASALWDDCLSSISFAGGADAKLRSGAVRETARSIGGIDDIR
jgi:propanediol dehydratase small subunit